MKTKTILLAFLAVTAGVFAFTRMNNAPPSDLRDAPADNFSTAIPAFEKDKGSVPDPKPAPAAVEADLVLVREYSYRASDADSKITARGNAIEALKRLALEEVGVNVLSQTTVENNRVVMDKIVSVAAGVTKTQVLAEKWDGVTYYCKARITIDAKSILELKKTAAFYEDNPPASPGTRTNESSVDAPSRPVEWVAIPAGKFPMGTDSGEKDFEDAKPIHEVAIKTFDMSKTAVTVEQYAECVIKGGCTEPGAGDYCNWGKPGRQLHPVNCVDWNQAQAYAKFKGARLPSEAEFEYAATSSGKNQKYPWGNQEPTSELAVSNTDGTMPVCSKPKGNTAQGLCDMAGNVWQWTQDMYQDSYKGAPVDGSAFEGAGSYRVMRGGSFGYGDASYLRADYRSSRAPGHRAVHFGFRLVR